MKIPTIDEAVALIGDLPLDEDYDFLNLVLNPRRDDYDEARVQEVRYLVTHGHILVGIYIHAEDQPYNEPVVDRSGPIVVSRFAPVVDVSLIAPTTIDAAEDANTIRPRSHAAAGPRDLRGRVERLLRDDENYRAANATLAEVFDFTADLWDEATGTISKSPKSPKNRWGLVFVAQRHDEEDWQGNTIRAVDLNVAPLIRSNLERYGPFKELRQLASACNEANVELFSDDLDNFGAYVDRFAEAHKVIAQDALRVLAGDGALTARERVSVIITADEVDNDDAPLVSRREGLRPVVVAPVYEDDDDTPLVSRR